MQINALLAGLRPLLTYSHLTVRQLAVLLLLAASDGALDFGTMANDLLLSKPSTNRNIDTLIELQLARRARNTKDCRKVFISITEAGRNLLGDMGVK